MTQCVNRYRLTVMGKRAFPLDEALLERLRQALRERTAAQIAARCECSPDTIVRAAAGQPVLRLTARAIERSLASVS